MMRIVLCSAALGSIALGLWLIAASFPENAPAPTAPTAGQAPTVAAPATTASPVVLGTALLAGGVVFLVLIFRRR